MAEERAPTGLTAAAVGQLADGLQRAYMRMIPHVGTPPWGLGSPEAAARDLVEDLVGLDPGLRLEAAQAILAAVTVPPDNQAATQIALTWWATPLGALVALDGQAVDEDATVSIAETMELLRVTRSRVYQLIEAGQLVAGPGRGTVQLHSVLRRLRTGYPQAPQDRPAYRYGVLLAACRAAAELAGAGGEYDKLEQAAMRTTTAYPAMRAAVKRWLTAARRRDSPGVREVQERFELAERDAGELPRRHLTLQVLWAEQADVLLGYHAARRAATQEQGRPP